MLGRLLRCGKLLGQLAKVGRMDVAIHGNAMFLPVVMLGMPAPASSSCMESARISATQPQHWFWDLGFAGLYRVESFGLHAF